MDSYKAQLLEKLLIGQLFIDYTIDNLINNGKSAAVFKATDKKGEHVAVKIFDNDLIERFGHEIQEKRIEQEISLRGHKIPNLIKIIDGGKTQIESFEYYYIVMEFIEGKNLKECIENDQYDNRFVKDVFSKLYKVTEALLVKGIVHRDIKPENIMISTKDDIVLMDLGVLKLIGVKSFSDQEEKQFVGTLRYAPPEFLTRGEEDSTEGWRSVNLYQIGGVLHDLLMKAELFYEVTPYANLVISIKEDAPKISNVNYPYTTVQIARDLLIKEWRKRLTIISQDRIDRFLNQNENDQTSIDKELESIFSLTSEHRSKFEEIEKITRSNLDKEKLRLKVSEQLHMIVNTIVNNLKERGLYTKVSRSGFFHFTGENSQHQSVKNLIFCLESDITRGFPRPLYLLVRSVNDENSLTTISLLAFFLNPIHRLDLARPLEALSKIREFNPSGPATPINGRVKLPSTFEAFNGTVGFDPQFSDTITLQIVRLIKKALEGVSTEVMDELDLREQFAKAGNKTTPKISALKIQNKYFYSIGDS